MCVQGVYMSVGCGYMVCEILYMGVCVYQGVCIVCVWVWVYGIWGMCIVCRWYVCIVCVLLYMGMCMVYVWIWYVYVVCV